MKTLRIENRWNKESSNFAIASFQTFKLQQSLHALHVLPPHNPRPNQPARKGLLFCFNPCECIQCHYILYNSRVLSTSGFFFCMYQEHRQTHGTTREPLLENITSDYDLELFRKAQARAAEDLVWTDMSHFCHTSATPLKPHPLASSHQIVNKDNSNLRLGLGTVQIWTGTVSVPEIRYQYPTVSFFYEWTPPSCLRFRRNHMNVSTLKNIFFCTDAIRSVPLKVQSSVPNPIWDVLI